MEATAQARVTPRTILGCCGVVILWATIPLALVLTRALVAGGTPTGAYATFGLDHLQYLAWVRDAGDHILIGNRFRTEGSDAVLLHPVFLISGLLWKLGLPIQLAWLIWAPVAVLVLLFGVLAYVRRLVPSGSARAAALVLTFFLAPPFLPLADLLKWGTISISELRVARTIGIELTVATSLWGYVPKAIAIGLMPIVFLALERAARIPARRTPLLLGAAAGALLVSWLHPWQGVALILVLSGLLIWNRFDRRELPLVAVGAAASVPLIYYFALSRVNGDWANAAADPSRAHSLTEWAVAAVLLSPLLLLAARGARGPKGMQDRILILWPLACTATAFLPSAGWHHAFAGASLPLAVLLVRGWQSLPIDRIRPGRLRTAVAVSLIAFIAVPGPLYLIRALEGAVKHNSFVYYSSPDEARALAFLRDHREDGAVFAAPVYGAMVPALTQRRVWSGHFAWTPSFEAREEVAWRLMDGDRGARAALVRSGATFFVADCRYPPAHVRQALGPAVKPLRTFGCAGVYRIVRAG